jgi:hypothetical protein
LFATGSFRSDSLATDSQNLVSAYCAIEKGTESFSRLTEQMRDGPGD